jgi:M6 family metalloprotease-like protein
VVILVNFSDVSFSVPDPKTAFDDLLNKAGYNQGLHIGSVSDYYTFNSGGLFTPDYVVLGPVTLGKTRADYGANDDEGNDVHPALMVKEACMAVNSQVNFSQFDADNDGFVDNVYVFFAGKGEADGGGENTIWPHSWGLSGESISLTLDNKRIENYACSAELKGNGSQSGIGTFTHEYGHIIGLPDLYDVDYDTYNGEAFDVGEWSLMAYGAYNGSGSVPPCLTLLERKLLGWANPIALSVPATIALPSLESSNTGYIINTANEGEYFLIENRQQTLNTWDAYLPHHGLLAYHIDMRTNASITLSYNGQTETMSFAELWNWNMVNAIASHQCADIEEADNTRIIYTGYNLAAYQLSLKGDPFPGTSNRQSFTDNTSPSMKTWNGTSLDKPITNITEIDNVVYFDFRGGSRTMPIPSSKAAGGIQPFAFTASWSAVQEAMGYYLDVFMLEVTEGDTIKTFLDGFDNTLVMDTFKIINVPSDLTAYYYQVRATDGFTISDYSDVISLTTTNSTPVIKPATTVMPFSFTANWEAADWATGYYLTVYELDEWIGDTPAMTILSRYNQQFVADSSLKITELDNERTYYYCVQATNNISTGRKSDLISVTTAKATEIIAYVKDRTIHVKGIDPGSTVTLYDLSGQLKQVSKEPVFEATHGGFYLAQVWLDGVRKILKIRVL